MKLVVQVRRLYRPVVHCIPKPISGISELKDIEGFRADWSQLEENEGFSNRPSAQNIWSWAKPWLWVVALIMYYRLDNRNRDSEEIILTFRYRYNRNHVNDLLALT